MRRNDAQYRGYIDLKKDLDDSLDYKLDRQALIENDTDSDKLETIKYVCYIKKDWVEAIEAKIEFIEKAIAEERQFITSNGEVIPIEKVKKVSKHSVEHLARHSDMITHVPEDKKENIVPDKMYMVEKLADYAVYENRFLYMMLKYLEQFIYLRIDKIQKLRRTYLSEFEIRKSIETNRRKFVIKTKITDNRFDNSYPIVDLEADNLLERANNCLQMVNAFLNTNLMQEVSKVPMIKPPVVKTNVLKMNNNFKNCLALYDFIASYKGDGYTVKEIKNNLAPFNKKIATELADSINLTAFTAYKWGNGINDKLERYYLQENERRLKEEEKLKLERLAYLKRKASESEKSLDEYLLALEERNKDLVRDSEELIKRKIEIEKLKDKIESLNNEISTLNNRIDDLNNLVKEKEEEIIQLNLKHKLEVEELKSKAELDLLELNMEYIQDISLLHECEAEIIKYQDQIVKEKLEIKILEYEQEHAGELESLQTRYDEDVEELNNQISSLEQELEENNQNFSDKEQVFNDEINQMQLEKENANNQYDELLVKYNNLEEKILLDQAELTSYRISQGLLKPGQEYTSREEFIGLEKMFNAFEKFMKTQWKMTKKQIRKETLWVKEEKDPKKKKKKDKEEVEEVKEDSTSEE